ncbi:hypothetical protein ASM1NWU_3 [Enterococcus phage AS-M1_NWU]|nr:hypothetical protein ASM1NWU_3 [Enterococcus phage AS-M1_NWU]
MSCKCFDRIQKSMADRVADKLPEGARIHSTGWKNETYVMRNKTMTTAYFLEFFTYYQDRRKDGSLNDKVRKSNFPVFMNYCPFCGVKFEEDEQTPVQEDRFKFPSLVYVKNGKDPIAHTGATLQRSGSEHPRGMFAEYVNVRTNERIYFSESLMVSRLNSGDYVEIPDDWEKLSAYCQEDIIAERKARGGRK